MARDEADRVQPDELMAYADGEASPEVAGRIEAAPELRAAALAYRRDAQRLQRVLHRFDCPPPFALGEYILGMLSPDGRTQTAAHVSRCPRCLAEVQSLQAALNADLVPTPAPAPAASNPGRLRRLVAALMPPAPNAAAQLRGGTTAQPIYRAESVSAIYRTESVSITFDLDAGAERWTWKLSGLVWRDTGADDVAGSAVALVADDGSRATTITDEWGNFTFDAVEAGTYQMEVTLGNDLIAIEGLRFDAR